MYKRFIFFFYLICITCVSLWPSSGLSKLMIFPCFDKFIHVVMYTGLTLLVVWIWSAQLSKRKLIVVFVMFACWGLLLEILQECAFINRSFDLKDEAANIFGIIAGWGIGERNFIQLKNHK